MLDDFSPISWKGTKQHAFHEKKSFTWHQLWIVEFFQESWKSLKDSQCLHTIFISCPWSNVKWLSFHFMIGISLSLCLKPKSNYLFEKGNGSPVKMQNGFLTDGGGHTAEGNHLSNYNICKQCFFFPHVYFWMKLVFSYGASEGLHVAMLCTVINPAFLGKHVGDKTLCMFMALQREFPYLGNI